MWRKAVILFALLIFVWHSDADQNDFLTRLKRSPTYCDYPPPPLPPPPPPPPFWYPPPPPPPPPPPSPLLPPPHKYYPWEHYLDQPQQHSENNDSGFNSHYTDVSNEQDKFGVTSGNGTPPCDKCSNGNQAVSNAKSDTGEAIAIAISKG